MRRAFPLLALVLGLGAVLALAAAAPAAKPAKAAAGKTRILFQWTEGDSLGQWVMTKHLGNLLDDLGQDKVQVEVITYGMATFAVTNRPTAKFAEDIHKLSERGVEFRVCHHAMDLLGVNESELLPDVKPVKGAMYEIVTRYHEGWQTLRP